MEFFGIKKYIEDELKRRGLKRIGKCNKCGKCCSIGRMVYNLDTYRDENDKNRIKVCGLRYKGIEDMGECKGFNVKKNLCMIENKPRLCEIFPAFPEDLRDVKEFCGYDFKKII